MRGQNCNGMLNRPATARWPAESSPRQAHAVLRAKRTLRADAGIRRALVRPIEFAGRSPRRPACVVGEQLRTDKIELWPLAPVEEDQHEYGSGGGKAGEVCSLAWQDGRKAAGLHEFRKAARKPRATNVPHRLAAIPRARLQTSPAFAAVPWEKLEAEVGVEPTRRGFADLGLPTWLLRRI